MTIRKTSVFSSRFDGVYMDTSIWINDEKAFEWKYGYSTFEFEITPFIHKGTNSIKVRTVVCRLTQGGIRAREYTGMSGLLKSPGHVLCLTELIYIRSFQKTVNGLLM